jgi:hypothetical protein
MNPKSALWIFITGVTLANGAAYGLDCSKPRRPSEKAICAKPELKALDGRLSDLEDRISGRLGDVAGVGLERRRKAWRRKLNACGADAPCLKRAMTSRLRDLQERFKPGLPCIKNSDIPKKVDGDSVWVSTLADVNGDGIPERILHLGIFGNGSFVYDVYLSSGGCFVPAGSVSGDYPDGPVALPSRHHGVSDLRGYGSAGCAGASGLVHFFEFDGEQYVENAKKTIACDCEAGPGPFPKRSPLCP